MKIRNGFVSNSSSSSFVVMGTRDKRVREAMEQKIELDNLDVVYEELDKYEIGYGLYSLDGIIFDCSCGENIYVVGVDLESDEYDDNITLGQIKDIAIDRIKTTLNIELTRDDLKIICDECSSE